jgi:spoIIIJ-associated protein
MKNTVLEAVAPTVEEAIEKGLAEMGLKREEVDVEILDEGKRNLFRFASRNARVRLILKGAQVQDNHEIHVVGNSNDGFDFDEESYADEHPELEEKETFLSDEDQAILNDTDHFLETLSGDPEDAIGTVKAVLEELLRRMEVEASLNIEEIYSESDNRKVIAINLEGDDLGYLIGRRSETLNALQYITSLIVSHRMQQWVPIQIDIQNYRSRRENELRKLARRMAEQVKRTGRRQFLEPMPANERRIIHMELRSSPEVNTESVGEDPNRKISIFPKDK